MLSKQDQTLTKQDQKIRLDIDCFTFIESFFFEALKNRDLISSYGFGCINI